MKSHDAGKYLTQQLAQSGRLEKKCEQVPPVCHRALRALVKPISSTDSMHPGL